MSVRAMSKLAGTSRNEDRCGVMLTTLLGQPVCTKIGRARVGPDDGSVQLRYMAVSGRQCEVVRGGALCKSEQCRSLPVRGATRTDVASC